MAIIELKGLQGVDKSNKETYINKLKSSGIIDNTWTDSEIDRVYRNDQFIKKFGEHVFNSISDVSERDAMFRNAILEEELNRYSKDPNINAIRNMTPEGQVDLFESGYLTPEERSKEALSGDLNERQEDLLDSASNVLGRAADDAAIGAYSGAGIAGLVGSVVPGVGTGIAGLVGAGIGGAVGAIKGTVEGLWERYVNPEDLSDNVATLNDKLFSEALERDIKRKRDSKEVKESSDEINSNIKESIKNGSIDFIQVDELFNSIVGNQGTDDNPSYGSIHYERFKDSLLSDIDEGTKIKVVSDFLAMQQLYPDVALAGIDQIFQDMAADRQSVGTEFLNVLKRNAIGLANDFAQIPTTLIAAGIQLVDGDEATRKFLEEGKIGNFDLGYFGPDYWNDAATYNTLDPDEIEKSKRLGGLSEGINIRETGASMLNPLTVIQESLGQIHYLGYYSLMGRFFGGMGKLGKGIDMTSKAGTAYKAASIVVPNLSMASQMGYEAYENTKDTLMGKYKEQVQNTFNELIQEELDKVDWNKELQNYKSHHSREGEKILISDEQIIDMLKQQKVSELAPTYMPIAESANADVLNEVRSQSIDAFRMETVMDLLKNSVNNATFRGWIYNNNKPLQNAIRNNELKIRFNGNKAIAPTKPKHLFLRSSAKEVAGEAFDEYLDGVTTGMAEGYNVAQFDGWLINRENPNTLDNTSMVFRALSGMSMGIRNSFNEDNLYESFLGALSPWMPLFNRSSRNPKTGKSYFITNGIYEEYVSQVERYKSVENRVAEINQFLEDNANRINNIARLDGPNAALQRAVSRGDEKARKDAEEQQLISLATVFNTAIDNASDADMVDNMTTVVSRLISDDYSDEEKAQLGNEFLSQPENKSSRDAGMTAEEGYERMRHNAQKLVDTAKKLKEVESKINNSPVSNRLSSIARNHLTVLAMQQEDWEARLNSIAKELGISSSKATTPAIEDMANKDDANLLVSEIQNSASDVKSNIEAMDKKISKLEYDVIKTRNDKKLDTRAKKEKLTSLNNEIKGLKQAKKQLKKESDRLSSLYSESKKALDNWSDDRKVISADDIMNSSASKILYMIENRDKYNTEQRAQIDETINRLTNNDPNFLVKLDDASRIASSMEEGRRASTAIQDGPEGYNELVKALEDAKIRAQVRMDANRYKNQLFLTWDSKTPEEILQDDKGSLELINEYRERNGRSRYDELQDIADVATLQNKLVELVNKEDQGTASALKQSIISITSQAKSKKEAIDILNTFINDKSVPQNVREDIKEVLDMAEILDKAASVTFKQEKEEIEKKEKKRKEAEKLAADYDAYQLAEAERMADEASSKKSPVEKETLEDNGQEVVEEVDKMEVGKEPVSQVDEEEVDLGIDYSPNTESVPSTETIIEKEIARAEKTGTITDVREATLDNEFRTGNAQDGEFTGNANSRYRVIDGIVKLREEVEKKTLGDDGQEVIEKVEGKLKAVFEWFDSANINYQEVIDNELNAISKLDPDVRILKVNPKYNETNDAVMQDIYMLVVEYTDDIAKIHKGADSIISADGKKWLVIGSLGYNNSVKSQTDKFKSLTKNHNPLDTRFRRYWRNNPTQRFHVDEVAHTKISRVNPGRLVRGNKDYSEGTNTVSEVLSRNGTKLRDAKWAIATGTRLKVIGRVENGTILNEKGVDKKAGTIYLLVPGAGGQYISSYIIPAFTNTLREGSELHTIISNALTKLANNDHKVRYEGLSELFQYIYLDGNENNILIGTEENNTITIIQGGMPKSYNLDDPNISKLSVISELLKSHFRIQVNIATLTNEDRLNLYDEGGALLTDLQKYGVSGADFNVYEMDENGNPNIPETRDNIYSVKGSSVPKKTNAIPYNGKLYVKSPSGWRDFEGTQVTDPTKIRHLQYLSEIQKGKTPYSSTNTHDQYVFDFNRDNPIVISVKKGDGTITELSKEQAIEYLDRQDELAEERERERAIDEAMKSQIDEESVDLLSDIGILDDAQVKGFEEFLYGDDEDNEIQEIGNEEGSTEPVDTTIESDPNTLGDTSPTGQDSGFTSLNEILIDHFDRLSSIIMEKQKRGEWLDLPMDSNEDLNRYIESKGMKVIGIDDVDAWFDILKNCR